MSHDQINVLYIWTHDVSLGDSLTNFHRHISIIKYKNPNSIIHCIVNPRTYNTGVTNILLLKGLIDFVYPMEASYIHNQIYDSYKNVLININFDMLIFNELVPENTLSIFSEIFPKSLKLKTENCKLKLVSIFEYYNFILDEKSLNIIKDSYNKNYVLEFVNNTIKLSDGKKTIGIFVGSTRKFANISQTGLKNIINAANELNIYTYLLGTSKFNLYNINGINWSNIFNNQYENNCNLIGNNWIKTLGLIDKLNGIVSGPIGAAMIPPLFDKNMIIIYGGDSSIMYGCLDWYTKMNNILSVECKCKNYPCDPNNINIMPDLDKYSKCRNDGTPYCINDELDIEGLKEKLKLL